MLKKLKHPELRTPIQLKEQQTSGWPDAYEINQLMYLWKVDTPVGEQWYIQRYIAGTRKFNLTPVDADVAQAMLAE